MASQQKPGRPIKKKNIQRVINAPETLSDNPFFGLSLDPEQEHYRDSIWDENIDIVFCNAGPGTGKTLIATATGVLLREYNRIDRIVYMSAAGVYEYKQGYLPGTIEQKSAIMRQPLEEALIRIGYDPKNVIVSDTNMDAQKEGTAYIYAQTDSYIRGINIGDEDVKTLLLMDESQNFTVPAIRTALTRLGKGSKAVVIGEDRQCDLKYRQDSGFLPAMHLFENEEFCRICHLSVSYRSRVAEVADKL